MDPHAVWRRHTQCGEGTLCNKREVIRTGGEEEGGGRSGPKGLADRLEVRVDACAFGLVGGRAAGEWPAAERSRAVARRRGRQRAGTGRDGSEVDREDGELALDVGTELRLLLADAEVALRVGNNRRAKELVPPWGGHRQGGNNHRPGSVRTSLGHKGVEQGRWREGEEGLAMRASASRAGRAGPVGDGEGVLGLSSGLSVPSEEARQQAVRRRGEDVQCEGPAAGGGQGQGTATNEGGADRTRDLEGAGA